MKTNELLQYMIDTGGDIRKIKRFLSNTLLKERSLKAYDLYLTALALMVNEVIKVRKENKRLTTTHIWRSKL